MLSIFAFFSSEFKYDGDDYIETIQAESDSMDKNNMGPQIVCINSDGGEYTHQIEVDEYQEDQLDEDALADSAQFVNGKGGPFKESSSVYYISAPTSNSTTSNTESHSQSSQRHTKSVSNASTSVHNDPDERFLLSCLPILKRLSTRKNALARMKIQQMLYEIEFDMYPEVSGQ